MSTSSAMQADVVDQTLLASLPDHGDHVMGASEGENTHLEISEIPK